MVTDPDNGKLQRWWQRFTHRDELSLRRKSLRDWLESSARVNTFLERGARTCRLQKPVVEDIPEAIGLRCVFTSWDFPESSGEDHFRLMLFRWENGEELRLECEVSLVEREEAPSGIVILRLESEPVNTTCLFLTRPDPAIPMLYFYQSGTEWKQTPVLEISRSRFKFQLPEDVDVPFDGYLVPDGYLAIASNESLPLQTWWKRHGKRLVEAEVESIRPHALAALLHYLEDRFHARTEIWDGLPDELYDDINSPGVRIIEHSLWSNLKALWVNPEPPPENWFPGKLETPAIWFRKGYDAVEVEYDALIGSAVHLASWLPPAEHNDEFVRRVAVIEHNPGPKLLPVTLCTLQIEKGVPTAIDWEAVFGWTNRSTEVNQKTVWYAAASRRDHFSIATQLSSRSLRLNWWNPDHPLPDGANILFSAGAFLQVKKAIDSQRLIPGLHHCWVISMHDNILWQRLGIRATGELSDWQPILD